MTEKPPAMTAPHAIRTDSESTNEERSFTHEGRTYVIKARKTERSWTIAAYLDDVLVSKEIELPHDRRLEPTPQGVKELLAELMVQVENDVHGR